MAKVTKEDLIASGDVGVKMGEVPPFMKDRYTLRCRDAEPTVSKSKGNRMIVLDCEIVEPQEKVFGGEKYDLTSLKPRYYLILEREGGHLLKVVELHERLGLEPIDDETPDVEVYKGLVFDAILSSREDKPQRKNDEGKYEAIKDSKGKEIKLGFELVCDIKQILEINNDIENLPPLV